MENMERELHDEIEELASEFDVDNLKLDSMEIPPRKSDLKAEDVVIVWTPWQIDEDGIASPLFELGEL